MALYLTGSNALALRIPRDEVRFFVGMTLPLSVVVAANAVGDSILVRGVVVVAVVVPGEEEGGGGRRRRAETLN